MSTIIFLRHAHSIANEKNLLAGRTPGIHLSRKGREQARELIERLGKGHFDHIHVSPMQRCQLTIDPWLSSKSSSTISSLEVEERFNEVDYGDWSNRSLSTLRRNPLWKTIQEQPSKVKFPGGESIKGAQKRAVNAVDELLGAKKNSVHLVVTHSDLIKVIAAHYLEMHLDSFQRIDVGPASFTVLSGDNVSQSLITLNSYSQLSSIIGKR